MTNVPTDIREMWADAYRLFDVNYNMGNTPEAWQQFWSQAQQVGSKYNNAMFSKLVIMVSEMIEEQFKAPCKLEDMNLF